MTHISRQSASAFSGVAATVAMTLASLGLALAAALFMTVAPASAQTCDYNSDQSSCACPTSGGGTTCFGGQLYRSTDSTCQADSRPCAANQVYNCASLSCACNTTTHPCGGCTEASSTPGGNCSAPNGGRYTDQCGACGCAAGTTLCASSNTCVADQACPTGSTWNPCTAACENPYVLISPSARQSGYVNVSGNISSGGDVYLGTGKAIRADGTGATTLNLGNWGSGATGFTVNAYGGFVATGNITGANLTVTSGGTVTTPRLCLNGSCMTSWPSGGSGGTGNVSTTDGSANYIPKFISTVDIGRSQMYDNGTSVGIGTTAPSASYKLDVGGGIHTNNNIVTDTRLGVATTPAYALDVNGSGRISGGLGLNAAPSASSALYVPSSAGFSYGVTVDGSTYGIRASGATGGGYFDDTDSAASAYLAYDTYGLFATGPSIGVYGSSAATGGYFVTSTSPVVATRVAYTNGGTAWGLYTAAGSIYAGGDVGIGTTAPETKLHIVGGTDSNNTTAGSGYVIVGPTSGQNLSIDDNEIIARSGVAAATLSLNNGGGLVQVGPGGLDVNGALAANSGNVSGALVVGGDVTPNRLCLNGVCNSSWPSGGLNGSGTTNYLAKFTGSGTVGSSILYDNGSGLGVGTGGSAVTKLQVEGGTDANGTVNTSGYMIVGTESGTHLALDNNEIMVRSGSSPTTLNLNFDGGLVLVGPGGLDVNGTSSATSLVASGGTTGVSGSGSSMGGYFNSSSTSAYARLGYGVQGIYAAGTTTGGVFTNTSSPVATAYLGFTSGSTAYGLYTSGAAYVGDKIGIGTTTFSSGSKLQVAGPAYFTGGINVQNGSQTYSYLDDVSIASGASISFGGQTKTAWPQLETTTATVSITGAFASGEVGTRAFTGTATCPTGYRVTGAGMIISTVNCPTLGQSCYTHELSSVASTYVVFRLRIWRNVSSTSAGSGTIAAGTGTVWCGRTN